MTTQVKDLPENKSDTVATRLRQARDETGLTRAEVTKETGIPAKSIEKFENGNQEPSVSRLVTLSGLYCVAVGYILGQDNGRIIEEPSKTEEPEMAVAIVETGVSGDGLTAIFDELDDMRGNSFAGSQRRAMALADELIRMLQFLEPDELIQVANDCDLFDEECQEHPSLLDVILDIFVDNPMEGQKYCGMVGERIIDTAIFGVDLYAIEMAPLEELAESLGIDNDSFFAIPSFEDHSELVPAIRSKVREMVISGNAPQFDNLELFPRRQ